MTDQPVQSQASLNRPDSNLSDSPLSITSSKASSPSRHKRFFSAPFISSTSSSKHKLFRSKSKSPVRSPSTSSNVRPSSERMGRSTSSPSYISISPRAVSPPAMSPQDPSSPVSPSRPTVEKRWSGSSRKSQNDYKRYSGTVNHYGRHSNDWLFGGFSVRETVRDGIDKILHHDDKEE